MPTFLIYFSGMGDFDTLGILFLSVDRFVEEELMKICIYSCIDGLFFTLFVLGLFTVC